MKVVYFLTATLLLNSFSIAEAAYQSEVYHKDKEYFINNKCKSNQSCHLKSFHLWIYKSKSRFNDERWNYGTSIVAGFETDSVDNLFKFGIVQFIRGCLYHQEEVNGQWNRKLGVREYLSKGRALFHHPVWQIDSIDRDPFYGSSERYSNRFSGYRFDKPNLFVEQLKKQYVLNTDLSKVKRPRLYTSDMPSKSNQHLNSFTNKYQQQITSLEFKTCIYKIEDIPLETNARGDGLGQPIHCFHWQSSYEFNQETNKIYESNQIDQRCLTLNPKNAFKY